MDQQAHHAARAAGLSRRPAALRGAVVAVIGVLIMLFTVGVSAAPAAEHARVSAALDHTAVQPGQQATVAVVIDVLPGYHIQSRTPSNDEFIKLDVVLDSDRAYSASAAQYPPGQDEEYPALGKLNVYTGRVIAYVPIEIKRDASVGPLRIRGHVQYQACDEKACYPPEQPEFAVDTRVVAPGEAIGTANAELFRGFDPKALAGAGRAAADVPGLRLFGRELTHDAYVLAFIGAFLIGIIFNVMPCVLPVVPLKAVGFYEVSQHHRGRSIALGAVFSVGIVATFAVLAVLVLVLHSLAWGQLFANAWFLAGIIAVLLVMALSMFGLFTVALPTGVYRFTPRHDTFLGNFLFGILTAILSTPCTFGMFLGLLVWATTQPAALGVALVMTVGVGMAFPYLLLSAVPELARRFPRTGPWAALVKEMMGFLLLASAVYFARRFVAGYVGAALYWWMLFAVVAAAGVFLVVRTMQFAKTRVGPTVAVLVSLAFVAPALAATWRLANPPIAWEAYSEAALAEARSRGRPVMVEFTADWCGNCLALEATVFHDPRVAKAIKEGRVVPLRADVTHASAPGWVLLREISPVGAIPLTAVYMPDRALPQELSGIYSAGDLLAALNEAVVMR